MNSLEHLPEQPDGDELAFGRGELVEMGSWIQTPS
jgi:hypothetical protein